MAEEGSASVCLVLSDSDLVVLLLIGGIRSAGFALADKFLPLVVNSLLETNLGMPYIFAIFMAYSSRFTEQLPRRKTLISFLDQIAEWNRQRVSDMADYE